MQCSICHDYQNAEVKKFSYNLRWYQTYFWKKKEINKRLESSSVFRRKIELFQGINWVYTV